MSDWNAIRQRHLALMETTADILTHVLTTVSGEQATTLRDGADGWTVLEILCHLRDFDIIFRERAIMMRDSEQPTLPAYDHEAMAVDRAYNQQNFAEVLGSLQSSRAQTHTVFAQLTAEQWERAGIHPERGTFSMTDAVMQVGLHDVTHIEQITRVLLQSIPQDDA
ncbi:MAG: DinB family protein [Anaerolineae bacterium]